MERMGRDSAHRPRSPARRPLWLWLWLWLWLHWHQLRPSPESESSFNRSGSSCAKYCRARVRISSSPSCASRHACPARPLPRTRHQSHTIVTLILSFFLFIVDVLFLGLRPDISQQAEGARPCPFPPAEYLALVPMYGPSPSSYPPSSSSPHSSSSLSSSSPMTLLSSGIIPSIQCRAVLLPPLQLPAVSPRR